MIDANLAYLLMALSFVVGLPVGSILTALVLARGPEQDRIRRGEYWRRMLREPRK